MVYTITHMVTFVKRAVQTHMHTQSTYRHTHTHTQNTETHTHTQTCTHTDRDRQTDTDTGIQTHTRVNNYTHKYEFIQRQTDGQTYAYLNYLPRVLSNWCISTGTLESSDSTLYCLLINTILTHIDIWTSITFPTGRLIVLEYS